MDKKWEDMTLEEKEDWATDGLNLEIINLRQNTIIIELLEKIRKEVSKK